MVSVGMVTDVAAELTILSLPPVVIVGMVMAGTSTVFSR
jgi:hypothetical protein